MNDSPFIDPRTFKRTVSIGEIEINIRALEQTKLKKSKRVTKFARKR